MVFAWLIAVAGAATPPAPGAVAAPAGAELYLPFPGGTDLVVSCGYGPSCSPYHSGTDATCCTNDHHALDLVRDQSGNGEGEPVVAAAAGTVVYADWAGRGWSTFGRTVLVEHDFGDGHSYLSLYAHMASLSVSVGDPVDAHQQVGTLGGSGNYGDGYFAPHLHFSLYQDASFTLGPYGGKAVVPEAIDGYEDLVTGDHLQSIGPTGLVLTVDDLDPGFTLSGPASEHTSGGYGSSEHFWYEPAAAAGQETTSAQWQPDVPEVGVYVVSAFIPYSDHATATLAPFTVRAHGEVVGTTQDQSIIGGAFHDLVDGRPFKLVEGLHGLVELHNGSGDDPAADVAFDAIRWVKVDDVGPQGDGDSCADSTECSADLLCDQAACRPPCWVSGCAPEGSCDDTTGLCDVWPEDAAGTTTDPETTLPPTEPTSSSEPPVRDELDSERQDVGEPPGGCGCSSSSGPGAAWAVLLVALIGRVRTAR